MFEMSEKSKKLLDLFVQAEKGTVFSYAEVLQKTGCDLTEGDRSWLASSRRTTA